MVYLFSMIGLQLTLHSLVLKQGNTFYEIFALAR